MPKKGPNFQRFYGPEAGSAGHVLVLYQSCFGHLQRQRLKSNGREKAKRAVLLVEASPVAEGSRL
jgi:hypothetical protein